MMLPIVTLRPRSMHSPLNIARLTDAQAPAYRALMLQAYEVPDAFTSTPTERAAAPMTFWAERVAHSQGLNVAASAC